MLWKSVWRCERFGGFGDWTVGLRCLVCMEREEGGFGEVCRWKCTYWVLLVGYVGIVTCGTCDESCVGGTNERTDIKAGSGGLQWLDWVLGKRVMFSWELACNVCMCVLSMLAILSLLRETLSLSGWRRSVAQKENPSMFHGSREEVSSPMSEDIYRFILRPTDELRSRNSMHVRVYDHHHFRFPFTFHFHFHMSTRILSSKITRRLRRNRTLELRFLVDGRVSLSHTD